MTNAPLEMVGFVTVALTRLRSVDPAKVVVLMVGVPPNVTVPVVVPDKTGDGVVGDAMVSPDPKVYVPVMVPLKTGVTNVFPDSDSVPTTVARVLVVFGRTRVTAAVPRRVVENTPVVVNAAPKLSVPTVFVNPVPESFTITGLLFAPINGGNLSNPCATR